MKSAFLFELSSGLTFYTYKVCNSLVNYFDVDITYMTEENNPGLELIDRRVKLETVLKPFPKGVERGSLKWVINRIYITMQNLAIRNKYLRKNKFDVISIQWTVPRFDQWYLKRIHKKTKIVLTVHDVIPPMKSSFWSMKSLSRIYHEADVLYVHTEANKNELIETFGIAESKIVVGCIGADREYKVIDKNVCREKLGLPKDKKIFLFYGSIREQKGLDILIKALKDIPNSFLFIAGALPLGQTFDKYQALIDENAVQSKQIIEYVPDELTDLIYQSCDFICLPYKYFHSQSGVLLQSLKYKKLIIASDVPSFHELIDTYKLGFLAEPENAEELHIAAVRACEMLATEKDISENFELALSTNSWEKCAYGYFHAFYE